jgi:hypothetical protein
MEEWMMNTIRGRPSLWVLREKYKPLETVERLSIDESWIGRECVVIYRYSKKIAGNWHQNILYHGLFSPGSYETHIWINDYNGHKGRVSKSRLVGSRFVIYIPHNYSMG